MKKVGIIAGCRNDGTDMINRVVFSYIEAIEDAGALAYIIPCNTRHFHKYISEMDMFVFPGGPDIDPSLYDEEIGGAVRTYKPNDIFLLSALRDVMAANKKVLGICKGMQLINIAHGGTLIQHLENAAHHEQEPRQYDIVDSISIIEGSFLEKSFQTTTLEINSIHHQGVKKLGNGLRVVAKSHHDGTIEALEHESLPIYGVQWHPEYLGSHRVLFKWFIES